MCAAVLTAAVLQAAMKAGMSAGEVGELLRLSSTKEVKDKLKSTTQEALNHGVRKMTLSDLFVCLFLST